MKKKKIILGFLVGIIALSTATLGVTLAWFASSRNAYVNAIDITIEGERGLDICTKIDGEYTTHYDYSELTPTTVFKPITSAYSSTWMDQKSDKPLFYDDSKYITTNDDNIELKPVNDYYYSQDFYLKSNDDVYVTVNPSETFFNPNSIYNKEYAEELYRDYQSGNDPYYKSLTKDDIEAKLNKLVDAMRFSILVVDDEFYDYGIIDPTKTGDTYLGGVLDNNIDRYYDFYHHDGDSTLYERVYGEIHGNRNDIVYDDALDADSGYVDANEEPSAFNAKHKAGVKRFNLEKTLQNGVQIQKEKSYSLADFNKVSKPFRIPVYKNTPQRIVVSIYIEGWDLDSVNYTMGATFNASLGLKIEREM